MKPILFNTAMVKAILEGEKTCTRRVIKIPKYIEKQENGLYTLLAEDSAYIDKEFRDIVSYVKIPYKVGDILYVRETWKKYTKRIGKGENCMITEFYGYKADEDNPNNSSEFYEGNWKPSIHMPKDATRIFLEVTEVKVERLQDITEDGAKAEGIREYTKDGNLFKYAVNEYQYKWSQMPRCPIEAFRKLWDSCYNWPKCWEYNPWVWVIEFKVKEVKK